MNEIIAAVLGAVISCFAMMAAQNGKRKEEFTVEIFKRLNSLEVEVGMLKEKTNK
mgnify:CR=1 FL=1|tara:strand:- start:618 stop:782 length:165 start_codon:yes stop_codon:yes gene_type:complete